MNTNANLDPNIEPEMQTDAIEDEVSTLSAHIQVATYRLLELIRIFDERSAWVDRGFASCAHWLSWRTGLDLGAAREKVRVAKALANLPRVSAEFSKGALSYSKARAITRIATPKNEPLLLNIAEHGTASHLEKLVRRTKKTQNALEPESELLLHESRYLNFYHDNDGMLCIDGRLPPEAGALVEKALHALMDASSRSKTEADKTTYAERRADALAELAEVALSHSEASPQSRRYQVVVHVDAQTLKQSSSGEHLATSHIEDGAHVSAEVSRRLSCDATVQAVVVDKKRNVLPNVLDVGRNRRTVPPALRRALTVRDGGCRFPGCTNHRFVDAHHIRHWADGGETKLDNVILLCKRHHVFLHEHGFSIEHTPSGEFIFYDQHGREIEIAPTPPITKESWGDDPIGNLAEMHRHLGVYINPETGVTKWGGERMDYDMAVGGVLGVA